MRLQIDARARVVIFTAYMDPEGERKYRKLGACAVIEKGSSIETLIATVRRELPAAPGAKPAAMPRVLVIDDEAGIRDVLTRFLKGKKFAVATAADGLAGVELAARWNPHLVLLDLHMPGLKGVEVLKLLRRREKPPRVIMVTAEHDPEVVRKCLDLGACDYVTKPFDMDYLERSVWVKVFLETGTAA